MCWASAWLMPTRQPTAGISPPSPWAAASSFPVTNSWNGSTSRPRKNLRYYDRLQWIMPENSSSRRICVENTEVAPVREGVRDFAVFGVPPYQGRNCYFTALTTIGMWSSTLQKMNLYRRKTAFLGGFSGKGGRSVIIGFQKTQIYQRFAGSRQEVFILKIQNNENNAANRTTGGVL